MSYLFGVVVWTVTRPSSLLLLLALIGVLAARRAWGRNLARFAMISLVAAVLLRLGDVLALPLESRFPAPPMPDRVDGVVVLGGFASDELWKLRGQPALSEAAERYTGMLELARRYPEAKLVFTSGSSLVDGESVAEADVVLDLAHRHGLDERRLLLDRDARNTADNARNARALARPRPGEHWLLVTSASHMPRAVGCFRKVGFDIVPWSVDFRGDPRPWPNLKLESGDRLKLLDDMAKEWVGLLYYRLLGHTSELFPGP